MIVRQSCKFILFFVFTQLWLEQNDKGCLMMWMTLMSLLQPVGVCMRYDAKGNCNKVVVGYTGFVKM